MSNNGRQTERAPKLPGADGDSPFIAAVETDQTLSDLDQTLSDLDQTHSDADQSASDADRRSSEAEQNASDRDQAAADRDHAQLPETPSSRDAHGVSRGERLEASHERAVTAAARAATVAARAQEAGQRDESARLRDLTALARDRAADARDRAAARARQAMPAEPDFGRAQEMLRVLRNSEAALRATAAADRARAAEDRKQAAADRERAAADRRQARIDLQRAHLDDLTGVYTRGMGLATLQHEIDRARRSNQPLVLAFFDVNELKATNDREGHAAGDTRLKAVVLAIRSALRAYDPVVRIGGDEFVCAFTNTELPAARRRVQEIQMAVQDSDLGNAVSVGLAELAPTDTLEELTARGDQDLYRARREI